MTPEEVKKLFRGLALNWGSDSSLSARSLLSDDIRELLDQAIPLGIVESRLTPTKGKGVIPIEYRDITKEKYSEEWIIKFNVQGPHYKIFKNVEHLAQLHPVHPPKDGILTDELDELVIFNRDDLGTIGKLKNYLDLTSVWKCLKLCSDDFSNNSLTFLYRRKLVIRNIYDSDALDNGFDGLSKLMKLLSDYENDKHSIEKNHILQNTLVSMLADIKEEARFKYLLDNFSKFSLRFDEAYQAYVVGFSFDKLREQHEERYREFMVSINNVISSVLTKSLMLPAGIYLASTRTQSITTAKDIHQGAEYIVSNLAIGIAAIIIAAIYSLVLISEKHSILAIKFEYESLMKRLEDKSHDAHIAIEGHRTRLKKRIVFAGDTIFYLHWINFLFLVSSVAWVLFRQF